MRECQFTDRSSGGGLLLVARLSTQDPVLRVYDPRGRLVHERTVGLGESGEAAAIEALSDRFAPPGCLLRSVRFRPLEPSADALPLLGGVFVLKPAYRDWAMSDVLVPIAAVGGTSLNVDGFTCMTPKPDRDFDRLEPAAWHFGRNVGQVAACTIHDYYDRAPAATAAFFKRLIDQRFPRAA